MLLCLIYVCDYLFDDVCFYGVPMTNDATWMALGCFLVVRI